MVYSSTLSEVTLGVEIQVAAGGVSRSFECADGHPDPKGKSVHERGGSHARRAPIHGKLRPLPRPKG